MDLGYVFLRIGSGIAVGVGNQYGFIPQLQGPQSRPLNTALRQKTADKNFIDALFLQYVLQRRLEEGTALFFAYENIIGPGMQPLMQLLACRVPFHGAGAFMLNINIYF